VNRLRQKPQKRQKPKEQKPEQRGVRNAVLIRWRRLQADDVFDDRVNALCRQYDLNNYLPTGKVAQGVVTGTPFTARERSFIQSEIAAGTAIPEGDRPIGEDFSSRLSKVAETLKREFALSADFEWLLRRYILWNDTQRLPTIGSGPTVSTTADHDGKPHVFIEVTPLTSIKDVARLWPIVQKQLRKAFPHYNTRQRSTLDEKRLQFILEKREQEKLTFPEIATAWKKESGQPTAPGAMRKAYHRFRRASGR